MQRERLCHKTAHTARQGEGMTLAQAIAAIRPPCGDAMAAARRRLDGIIKPLGGLGELERHWVRLAGASRQHPPPVRPRAVAVFCADNGVVDQGISQSGREVTCLVTENLARGDTCVCAMARVAGARVVPVDIGVAGDPRGEGILRRKVARGTRDFSKEPAMTRREAVAALEVGIGVAEELRAQGCRLLATGEMGIGNTTTSAAVASALLGLPAGETAGRGAGLTDAMLERKIQVIDDALARHRPDPGDPLDVLCKVGGLDIAGMAGLCIGGAALGVPVVLDGLISCVSALLACRLAPAAEEYLLPSHRSGEPASGKVLEALGMHPPLDAGLRLGEGTGAVALFPLYDMMEEIAREMISFDQAAMEPYRPLGGGAG